MHEYKHRKQSSTQQLRRRLVCLHVDFVALDDGTAYLYDHQHHHYDDYYYY